MKNLHTRFLAWCRETVSKTRARTLYISAGALLVFVAGIIVTVILISGRGGNVPAENPLQSVPLDSVEVTPFVEVIPEPVIYPLEDDPDELYSDPPAEPEPEPDPGPPGLLTGLPIHEGYVNRRPIAVVVNNIFAAHPQSGISSADVVYEVLTEGNITRLIAVFQTEIPDKIGPVRSTRNYFAGLAMNHDAIFVHHGGT
ncbi:MAG: DUF3048 domain-containing protein [Defluviitaleaceae bacterium]|nr:DUF3048 domain-containing protein [Defluviitaleaceae bacterium]